MEAEEVEYGPWKRGDSFDSSSKFVLADRSFTDWSIVIYSRRESSLPTLANPELQCARLISFTSQEHRPGTVGLWDIALVGASRNS